MGANDNPLKILVVEDDKDFALILNKLFKKEFEAETLIAEDCSSAREALAASSFDLITLDYQLPDGNGLEILKEITSVEEHPPIIMVTGQGDEKTAAMAIELNADGYVVKDTRVRVLLTGAVEKTLEKDQFRKALRKSEQHYRELIELANSIVLKMDGEGNLVFMNEYGFDFFGYSSDEIIGKNVVGTIVPEVESTGRGLSGMIGDIVVDPDAHRSNFNENILKSGKRVWILWANRSICDESGNLSGTLSIGNDVTELLSTTARVERLKRLYALVVRIVNKLTLVSEPQELYEEACRTVVEGDLIKTAWIGLQDEQSGEISPVASEGCDEEFLKSRCLGPEAPGERQMPAEAAVQQHRSIVCNDLTSEEYPESWRKEAITRGYRACAAFPLIARDNVRGIFCLYTDSTSFFEKEITELFESMARYISFFTESYECRNKHEQVSATLNPQHKP